MMKVAHLLLVIQLSVILIGLDRLEGLHTKLTPHRHVLVSFPMRLGLVLRFGHCTGILKELKTK